MALNKETLVSPELHTGTVLYLRVQQVIMLQRTSKAFADTGFAFGGFFLPQEREKTQYITPSLPSNPKFLLILSKSTGSNPLEGLFISLHLINRLCFMRFIFFPSHTKTYSRFIRWSQEPQFKISGLSIQYNTQHQIVFNPKLFRCTFTRWKLLIFSIYSHNVILGLMLSPGYPDPPIALLSLYEEDGWLILPIHNLNVNVCLKNTLDFLFLKV